MFLQQRADMSRIEPEMKLVLLISQKSRVVPWSTGFVRRPAGEVSCLATVVEWRSLVLVEKKHRSGTNRDWGNVVPPFI